MKTKNGIVREFLIALMILVCVMGLIGVLTIYATEDNTEEELYEYEVLEDGTVEITGYLGNEKEIIIPEMIDGKTVTRIGSYAFERCNRLTKIIIPSNITDISENSVSLCFSLKNIYVDEDNEKYSDMEGVLFSKDKTELICYPKDKQDIEYTIPSGVTSIGYRAFTFCRNLKEITILEGVTSIGEKAFEGCRKLTKITISESVTSIGNEAFRDCSNLTNIEVDVNNQQYSSQNGILFNKEGTELIRYPEGKQDLEYEIPSSVNSIGNSAFAYCSDLTNITIPSGVTSIGYNAFEECSSLTEIIIPSGVTSIENGVFYGCGALTEITIPTNATRIGDWAFCYCSNLTDIIIPESVTSIGGWAFNGCSNLTSITMPAGVTSIEMGAFEGCSSLTEITIPTNVTSIANSAFSYCSNLTRITIPENVKIIDYSVFDECPGLTYIEVDVNNSQYSSENGVLFNKEKTEIICYPEGKQDLEYTIPTGVASIGFGAFSYCSNLTSITIPEGVTSIGTWAFDCCSNLTSITIPESVTFIDNLSFGVCESLTNIEVDVNNLQYSSENGVLFNKEKTELIYYPEGKQDLEYTIPSSVTSLEYGTFYNNNLIGIKIPENVTSIDDGALEGCTSLTNIEVDVNNSQYSSENGVLFNKEKTELIRCPEGKQDLEYIVPSSVTTIRYEAFYQCSNLTSITISENVTNIEDRAFSGFNGLTNINVSENNSQYSSENGVLFNKAKTELIYFPEGKHDAEYIIPSSVRSIKEDAFDGATLNINSCENNIEVPEILKRTFNIEDILYAHDEFILFSNCSLSEDLTKIIVNDINEEAFIEIHDGALTGLTININIQRIGENENIEISTEEYTITGNNITDISPATSIATFIEKIATNCEVKIQKDGEEVTDQNVKIGTGMILVVSTNSEQREYVLVVTGDLNGDGEMGDIDLLRIARYNAGLDKGLSGAYLEAADIYKDDNKADNKDLLKLVRILVGLDSL